MQHAETPEQAKPPSLKDQEAEFTAEGSPPPGKVAGVLAPATPDQPVPKPAGRRAVPARSVAAAKGASRQKKR